MPCWISFFFFFFSGSSRTIWSDIYSLLAAHGLFSIILATATVFIYESPLLIHKAQWVQFPWPKGTWYYDIMQSPYSSAIFFVIFPFRPWLNIIPSGKLSLIALTRSCPLICIHGTLVLSYIELNTNFKYIYAHKYLVNKYHLFQNVI